MKKFNIVALWMPFPKDGVYWGLNCLAEEFRSIENITFIDLKSNKDAKACEVLRTADLVLVGLPQDREILDAYFSGPIIRFKNVTYVILDYFGNDNLNKIHISNIYRIPIENIATVPRNVHINMADSDERYRMFTGRSLLLREEASYFKEELFKVGEHILRKISQE